MCWYDHQSGFHRQLGTSITKVRSVNLDKWNEGMIDLYQHMNNQQANSYWEMCLPAGFERPTDSSANSYVWSYINNKYVKKKYAPKHTNDPATEYMQLRNTSTTEQEPSKAVQIEAIKMTEQSKPYSEILIGDINEDKTNVEKPKNADIILISYDHKTEETKLPVPVVNGKPNAINLEQIKLFYGQNKKSELQNSDILSTACFHSNNYSHEKITYTGLYNSNKATSKIIAPRQQINAQPEKEINTNEKLEFEITEFLNSMGNKTAKKQAGAKVGPCKGLDDIPTKW